MSMNNRALKIMTVVFIIFALCACSSKKEDDKPAFDISGKTYYNTVDDFNHSDHAKVWFGRNGTFVLNDSYKDGYYEMNGTWELNEDVCTLNVENDSSFSKVIFEVKDDNTIVLKTTLLGSRSDSIFSTTETKGSNSSSSNTNNNASSSETKPEETKPDSTKPEESKPETDSKPKEETSTKDVPCTGLSAPYHNYWAYEGVKDWDLEIVKTPENTTDKITYKSNDEKVVKVDENGKATTVSPGKTTIDITCGSQKLTIGFETRSKDPEAQPVTYKAKIKDVNDQFQPSIYLDGKGNFVFTENLYAGMGEYKGTYKKEENHYILSVKDISFSGFMGDSVKEIDFKIVDDATLKLKTQLCMSSPGELFYKQ